MSLTRMGTPKNSTLNSYEFGNYSTCYFLSLPSKIILLGMLKNSTLKGETWFVRSLQKDQPVIF